MKLLLLCLLQSMLLAVGQVFLKLATHELQPFGWHWTFWRSVLLNVPLAMMGLCYGAAGLLWLWIVKHYPLSQAYPLTSLSFVFGILLAIILLGERVSVWGWLGVACIVAGCMLITLK